VCRKRPYGTLPRMRGFDAELYLRLLGEQMLVGSSEGGHPPWRSPLAEAAGALVAIDAINSAKARAVIADYGLANALRHERLLHLRGHYGRRSRRRKTAPLKPRRVVACGRAIEHAQGMVFVKHVVLAEDSTAVSIRWRPSSPPRSSRPGSHGGHFGLQGPIPAKLKDDQGKSTSTSFNGGGSDEEWEGHLRAARPLSPDTSWIEIDGERIDLLDAPWPCDVSLERLPDEPPAHRYLRHQVAAAGSHFHGPPDSIERSIDALTAAGALDGADPVIDQLRAVVGTVPHQPGTPAGARRLPEPWRSLPRRQGKVNGPELTIPIGATTPLFDGFSVAVTALESRRDSFAVHVEVTPGMAGHGPWGDDDLPAGSLAWWAADDRGNAYLGQMGSWSGGDDHSDGEINFEAALDPNAKRLRLMPTGPTMRAVIEFPLERGA
jgi:hypothetical protein